jgi:hypothetical protein
MLGALSGIAAVICLFYVVFKTAHLPEMTAITGLSGFATAHYLINRVTTVTDNATSNVVKDASNAASQAAKDSTQ